MKNQDKEALRATISRIVEAVVKNFEQHGGINHIDGPNLPSQEEITELAEVIESVLFPGFIGKTNLTSSNILFYIGDRIASIHEKLMEQVYRCLRYVCDMEAACDPNVPRCPEGHETCKVRAQKIAVRFLERIPELRNFLSEDVNAAYQGDPAAKSFDEIILSYPGVRAIAIYRMAHTLCEEGVPLLPRIMTEYAHAKTGVDIHPGAEIGRRFFIDHGTGVVIGETTEIGDDVKIYQGVTLGALSVPEKVEQFRGRKRHPTIKDGVTIYAGATILGGETVIGKGSVIGGNVWLIRSVPPGSRIVMEQPRLLYRPKGPARSGSHPVDFQI